MEDIKPDENVKKPETEASKNNDESSTSSAPEGSDGDHQGEHSMDK